MALTPRKHKSLEFFFAKLIKIVDFPPKKGITLVLVSLISVLDWKN